jgi:DnaK suppressor protein
MTPVKPCASAARHHRFKGVATMSTHLTTGQKALIEAALRGRDKELRARLQGQQQGQTRAEHARAMLEQDGDDAPQRQPEREIDFALTEMESAELGQIARALQRLAGPDFGLCEDCGVQIPFDRLTLEPHAMRCVACETARERHPRA